MSKVQRQSRTSRWQCVVFTEQGSSASQMTAAKVMDIISRLPGCAGQAADAVSANTQVKMEDARTLLKIAMSECPDVWIRLPKHKWPKSWSSMEDPVVPLARNLYGHPLAELLWERQFEKVLLEHGWGGVPNREIQHHLLTMFIWVALKENVKLVMILCIITEECSNLGFLPGLWKKIPETKDTGKPDAETISFMVLWHGRSCKEMRGKILGTGE